MNGIVADKKQRILVSWGGGTNSTNKTEEFAMARIGMTFFLTNNNKTLNTRLQFKCAFY